MSDADTRVGAAFCRPRFEDGSTSVRPRLDDNAISARPRIIAIVGANASGKSGVGIELAKTFGGEILSADSRQVYRGFNLCSGKVTVSEREAVPHHMLDIADVGQRYSVADYQSGAYGLIPEIAGRGKLPFLVGGTGLYIDAVTQGYDLTGGEPDPERRTELEAMPDYELRELIQKQNIPYRTDSPNYALTKHRMIRIIERAEAGETLAGRPNVPRFNVLTLGLKWEKELLHKRIDERLKARLKAGMIDEVKVWLENGGNATVLEGLGLEFKYISLYLRGAYKGETEFRDELGRAIRHFAKRQMTWFRRHESTVWIDMAGDYRSQARAEIDRYLSCETSLT